MKTADFLKLLEQPSTDMPRHYSGPIIYQRDAKFERCSIANANSYVVLGEVQGSTYLVTPHNNAGYVFETADLKSAAQSALPQMRLLLRDTPFSPLKQAHNLRIRESCSRQYVAAMWYNLYVEKFGGIVSDRVHLEGGRTFWQSFIKQTSTDPSVAVWEADWKTGKFIAEITIYTPESEIWSSDDALTDRVMVFARRSVIAGG